MRRILLISDTHGNLDIIHRKDFWFKKMWNINLPDVQDGHALLIVKDSQFSLETYSAGIQLVE